MAQMLPDRSIDLTEPESALKKRRTLDVQTFRNHMSPIVTRTWGECIQISEHIQMGKGSYGSVYAVTFQQPDGTIIKYAAKKITTLKAEEALSSMEVFEEITAMYALNKKGFGPTIYGWWKCPPDPNLTRAGSVYYILMELMKSSVTTYLGGRFVHSNQDMADMMAEAKRLDDAKIIHGDMKPDNMMRNKQGRVVAVDFGFMKAFDGNIMMDFTTRGYMGWMTSSDSENIPFPNYFVPHINQLQLMCYLRMKYREQFPDNIPDDFPAEDPTIDFADQIRDYIFRHGLITSCCSDDFHPPPPPIGRADELKVQKQPEHSYPHDCPTHPPDGVFRAILITRIYPASMHREPLYLFLYDMDTAHPDPWALRLQKIQRGIMTWDDSKLSLHWCTKQMFPGSIPLLDSYADRPRVKWVDLDKATIDQFKHMVQHPPESHIDYWMEQKVDEQK